MIDKIEKIIKMFENASISKLELEVDNIKLKLEKDEKSKDSKHANIVGIDKNINEVKIDNVEADNNKYVTAPVVGTFYSQRSEKSPKFIEVGSKVKKGDVLCIIEAMKVMNEVLASEDGTVLEILVKNEELVQFGQKLIVLG